jgi:hypothetical protein
MNLREQIKRVLREEITEPEYAVIEILKPSSRMPLKWYFQEVPLHKTKEDKIYIKRGPAGTLTISTKNIKIRKIFKKSEKEEMDKYLEKLRDEDSKKGINESLRQMMRLLKETKERIVFDMQDLLDRGIIFITQAHDLKTGKMIQPEVDPETGEMYHDSTNLITLWNILYPEQGEQDGIPKALKHPRPDQVQYWQEHQDELGEEKYNQILRSIKLEESDKEETSNKGINESLNPFARRRFNPDDLAQLVKDVKNRMKVYENSEDAIYDAVRQLIATKNFKDIDNATTDNEYWDSYLKYEEPIVDYVKEKLGLDKEEMTEAELTEKCWKGYTQKGMKTMFGKRYPNCVKKTK